MNWPGGLGEVTMARAAGREGLPVQQGKATSWLTKVFELEAQRQCPATTSHTTGLTRSASVRTRCPPLSDYGLISMATGWLRRPTTVIGFPAVPVARSTGDTEAAPGTPKPLLRT